ncbi:hypothetical protein ZIOFF_035832 [Zingiber officinale]|uniref:cyclin-dependent kinase n=1 Tax=Zingiber officinale TaxID=94328 RepID=A0A8J5L2Y5_ZINOF|nr:hypothetical protein ZIOFF_035832 [Zingiber officinale]
MVLSALGQMRGRKELAAAEKALVTEAKERLVVMCEAVKPKDLVSTEALEKVREGTYGKVYKAREKATGKIVALKKTRLLEDDEGVPPTTLREVSLLHMLSIDPHVVRLLDLKQDQNKEGKTILYLVFEYMDTDLKKYIRSFRQSHEMMPPMTVKILMNQLCKGISFCHGHGVLHRDLKPHNLLMDCKTMMPKVADLGLNHAFTIPLKKYTHEVTYLLALFSHCRTYLITYACGLILQMEMSKETNVHSSVHSSQQLPVSVGAKSESRGTIASSASRISQDKSPMPTSSGGFHNSSTISHVPVLAFAAPNLNSRDKALPSAHNGLNAKPSGPSYLTQDQAENPPQKIPTISSMQSPSVVAVSRFSQPNKLLDHTSIRSEGIAVTNASQSSHQMKNQEIKSSSVQAGQGGLHITHQPTQGLAFFHAPSLYTNHNEIGKSVQRILQSKVLDHPNWIPPSSDYMNASLNCQICKNVISDTESLLVCDACEKGNHLKCLQSYGSKDIPKAEWHCPSCLASSNGKTLPPKYGRSRTTRRDALSEDPDVVESNLFFNTSVAVALCLLLLILWGFCNDHPISAFLTLPSQSFAYKKAATGSEVASLEYEGSEYQLTSKAPCMGTELSEKDEENSISDDENLIEISLPDGHFLAHDETKALLNLEPLPLLSGFLPSPLQDAVVRQQGVMELLPEINEEENLIEIDIVRGSIKCLRIGIKT